MEYYYVYFRLLGKVNSDKHCMKVESDSILNAKNKVRNILNRKFKEYVIIFVSKEEIEL